MSLAVLRTRRVRGTEIVMLQAAGEPAPAHLSTRRRAAPSPLAWLRTTGLVAPGTSDAELVEAARKLMVRGEMGRALEQALGGADDDAKGRLRAMTPGEVASVVGSARRAAAESVARTLASSERGRIGASAPAVTSPAVRGGAEATSSGASRKKLKRAAKAATEGITLEAFEARRQAKKDARSAADARGAPQVSKASRREARSRVELALEQAQATGPRLEIWR